MKNIVWYCFALTIFASCTPAQRATKATYSFEFNQQFTDSLSAIVKRANLDGIYDAGEDGMEKISFAVIDFTGKAPVVGGYEMHNFIYPASVYKMYIAMEVLKQISEGRYSLYDSYVVKAPNDVDRSLEIKWDPRPLLKAGDTVTVGYLIDLMITRSDNSASNCLIDLADRKHINATMHSYGWRGSEVTRKFLSRKVEAPGYDTIAGTMTNAFHAADFMYRVQTNTLVNPWVSQQLKSYLGRQLDTTKLAAGLPTNAMFYHKSGWWSYFTNDVGIVDDGQVSYIIALFTPVRETESRPRIHQISAEVYQYMRRRHKL